ncbi:FmdB family zinc ribbon protein [Rhodohalobacter sp. 614A]|uniref:FmdB family zinc ribbon protein n=1 Tax=Rhodohalobacter sp. 614A TaxID=2908649 RepID=UPI001F302745|nr:FmdB family zinc ribbon protein [Rhodohalobacter sp. 614A]
MPTYEYKREDGSVFEITQSINDDPLETCPTTGQPVKRIISGGGGVVYKGTGWYVTDYKNGAHKNINNSEPKTSGKTDSTESKAKDSKDSKE